MSLVLEWTQDPGHYCDMVDSRNVLYVLTNERDWKYHSLLGIKTFKTIRTDTLFHRDDNQPNSILTVAVWMYDSVLYTLLECKPISLRPVRVVDPDTVPVQRQKGLLSLFRSLSVGILKTVPIQEQGRTFVLCTSSQWSGPKTRVTIQC